jgi:hypothetical protein
VYRHTEDVAGLELGVEPRRVHRRLQRQAEVDHVHEHLQDLLILAVASGRPDCQERRAVPGDDRRRQGGSRSLPWSDDVRAVWFEPEGLCGFAWVKVTPGNSSFAKWLLKQKIVSGGAYGGGVDIWVSAFGQSYERKDAYAQAMAKVLVEELGIKAYAQSRLD